MSVSRRSIMFAAVIVPVLSAFPVFAESVVSVSLWDKPDMDMAGGLGHGMGGDMATANMGITLSATSVNAGKVTFEANNDSKDVVHEMVVAPLASPDAILPFNEGEGKVDEDAAGHIGEVAELEPGQSGALTVNLKPGTYILYCNIPGHYMAGMWTTIEVK